LALRSGYLKKLFQKHPEKGAVIKLDDISKESFEILFRYCYTSVVEKEQVTVEFLEIASRYEMDRMIYSCWLIKFRITFEMCSNFPNGNEHESSQEYSQDYASARSFASRSQDLLFASSRRKFSGEL